METIEMVSANGRKYNATMKKLNTEISAYLAQTEEEGERCLLSVNITHTAVLDSYNIEHFFCATIVTAPIGNNTQYRF